MFEEQSRPGEGSSSDRETAVSSSRAVTCRASSVRALALALIACVVSALALAAAASPASAAACPNEQLRKESNTNPATGEPYSTGLPECRAYEMVSPAYKQAHDAVTPEDGLPVAPDGQTVGFESEGAFSNPENSLAGFEAVSLYTSQRGASAWSTSSSFAPASIIPAPPQPGLSSDFSPDLRSAQASSRWSRPTLPPIR